MAPGRKWLAAQPLAEDELAAVDRWLAALDAMERKLAAAEAALASACLGDEGVRWLMKIGGMDMPVAAGMLWRSSTSRGSPPPSDWSAISASIHACAKSGDKATQHGRIGKQGRAHARGMLVEAAWAAAVTPGPLRAFFLRIPGPQGQADRSRRDRPQDRSAGVALCSPRRSTTHGFDLSLTAMKRGQMQLKAGAASRGGGSAPGPAQDYSGKTSRE